MAGTCYRGQRAHEGRRACVGIALLGQPHLVGRAEVVEEGERVGGIEQRFLLGLHAKSQAALDGEIGQEGDLVKAW